MNVTQVDRPQGKRGRPNAHCRTLQRVQALCTYVAPSATEWLIAIEAPDYPDDQTPYCEASSGFTTTERRATLDRSAVPDTSEFGLKDFTRSHLEQSRPGELHVSVTVRDEVKNE